MAKGYIKNIPHETVLALTDQIQVSPGQVVSRTLVQNNFVSITLFAFARDEEIATHSSTGDAMVTVLDGTGRFTIGEQEHIVHAGETLIMPANIAHALYALENFKMMLTIIFSV